MKQLVWIICAAFVLIAISCANDSANEELAVVSEQLSFRASFDDTKTAVDISSGKVSWREGDLVRYYSKSNGDVSSLTVSSVLDGGTAQFEPNIGWSDSFLVAVYGGTAVSDNDGSGFTLTGAIIAQQSGRFADSHIAAAKISKDGGSWPEAIRFSNLVPFLSFTLGPDAPAADYAVFESEDQVRLHADGKILVSFDGNSLSGISLPSEGGGSTVRIPVSGEGTYYIALAPGTYNGFKISFYKSGGAGDSIVAEVSSDKVLLLSRGKLIRLGTLDYRMEQSSSGPDAGNLSFISAPQDINNGIAAFKYRYLRDNYYKINSTPVDDTVVDDYYATIKFPQDNKRIPAVEGSNGKKVPNILAWTKNNGTYSIGGKCLAEYDIKPADSSIDGLSWFWNWGDSQNGSFSSSVSWQPSSPELDSFESDRLRVSYTITGADKLGSMTDVVSCLQLGASSVNNGETKTAVSDYQAVIPYREALHALAFKTSTSYRTKATDCPLLTVNQSPHLYTDAKTAAMNAYSVPVVYNAGPFSLDIVNVHMKKPESKPHLVGDAEQAYSIEEIRKYYPNLKLHFEPVSYTLGSSEVGEDKYCNIYEDSDGKWWFQPMYVNKCRGDGSWDTSANCSVGGTAGISAVGHRPVVLVTLVDTANNDKVVLEGYFKTMIVNDPAASLPPSSGVPNAITSHVFDFNPFGALCNPEADPIDPADFYNNWEQYNYRQKAKGAVFSCIVLEQTANMSVDQFKSIFAWENFKTYVKKNNQMVATNDYGRIIYVRDLGNYGFGDHFVVLFRKENYDKFVADKITEKEIYAHFTSLGQGDVWLGFKVSIVGGPAISFAEKNPKNWFDDLTEKRYNQNIRIGAKVPNNSDVDVTRLDKFFDDNWVGNTVKLTLGTDQVSMYYKYLWGEMPVEYEYIFSKTQDNFVYPEYGDPAKTKTAKFYVSDDQKTVYIDAAHQRPVASITRESYVRDNGVYVFDPPRNADKFTYLCNDYSKELLNAYAFKNEDDQNPVGEMLYFKVDLVATYGTCKIPCGTYTFPVRMIPPVSVRSGSAGNLRESPTGSSVEVGTLFRVFDYHNLELFLRNNNQYAENVVDGINLYRYYGAERVSFDIDNAMTDQTGEYKYLFDHYANNQVVNGVNNEAKLWVAHKAAPQTSLTPGVISITQVNNLANYVLHYEYYGSDNDYHLRIPCTFTYKWGDVYGTIEILVEHNSTWN